MRAAALARELSPPKEDLMKKLLTTFLAGVLLAFASLLLSGTAFAQAASAPAAAASAAVVAAPAEAASAPAAAAPAAAATPVPNKGDTAFMTIATALVIMMTIPGLALFYGGLVRSKNILSVLMQVFVVFAMIVVLWVVYGYSLAFTEGNAFIGGLDRLFLKGVFDPATGTFAMAATFSKGVVIP
jgi:Amt family ammonium transporter